MSEEEHRCRRCGRRPGDTLPPEIAVHRTDGALAAQVRLSPAPAPEEPPERVVDLGRAVQRPLFQDRPAPNVIPFESYAAPVRTETPRRERTSPRSPARRASRTPEGQGSLDFLPSIAAKPRTLDTTVEARVCCEAPVATRLHRALGAVADLSMILIGYGLFLLAFSLSGGQFALNKTTLPAFAGMLAITAFLYGLLWALAGGETAGMRWMRLRLLTFDGFRPDLRQRLLRYFGSCLSMCTLLGLLWSLADEESLTWQDHISSTFPTPVESGNQVFQRR